MKVILLTLMFAAISAVNASSTPSEPRFEQDKLFVKVKKGSKLPQSSLIKSAKHLFGENYLVKTQNASLLAEELKSLSSIARIEKSYYAGKKKLPAASRQKLNAPREDFEYFNDPLANRVWAFRDADAHGVSAHKSYLSPLNINKEEVIVAVVDTGVDYRHEDLRDIMWVNHDEIPGNGIDDDQNGYIDDVYGIDPLDDDTNPMASHAHGTHVAGTIAATQNNGIGIAGIASNVKIMAIRTVPDDSDETDADVVESFLYAAKNGAKIINCSFGKSHNEGGMIVNETMDHIGKEFGAMVVAAAGNDYRSDNDVTLTYPASFPSDYLMVIASTTRYGGLSSFSNIGANTVDLAAPGSSVFSTMPGNGYANMSGTSMATPTAVGVTAEVLSHFPELDPISLRSILMNTVTKVDKFDGLMVTSGRIDLYNALQFTEANYRSIMHDQVIRNHK